MRHRLSFQEITFILSLSFSIHRAPVAVNSDSGSLVEA